MAGIRDELRAGRVEAIDADLSAYFDTIDHAMLLKLVSRRVSDGSILKRIKQILRAPIVERTRKGQTLRANKTGTPQGGVLSPLLANLYLNGLDHAVNDNPGNDARLIRYADDFVILTRPGKANGLLERLKRYLAARKLKLNETKTRVLDSRWEHFEFLGFEFARFRSPRTRVEYVHVQPCRKARLRLRDEVRKLLNNWTHYRSCVQTVRELNRLIQGWSNYYAYWHYTGVFASEQMWVQNRLRRWLWRKYGRKHSLFGFFNNDRLHGQYKLWKMPVKATWNR